MDGEKEKNIAEEHTEEETPPPQETPQETTEDPAPAETTQETPAADPVPAVDVLMDAMKADYEKRMEEMRKEYEKGLQERDKMIRELVTGEYKGTDKQGEKDVTEVTRRIREQRGTFSKYR